VKTEEKPSLSRIRGRHLLWFVPLWIAGAVFMIAPGWAILFVMPIVAIVAITPFRTGRMSGLLVLSFGIAGLFAAAGIGLAIKMLLVHR